MSQEFTPIIFLKQGCQFCFKLRLFLLEAGLSDKVTMVQFTPGTAEEDAVRDKLAPHFEKITFPSAEVAPGNFRNDSDWLIEWFANRNNVDLSDLPTFQAYLEGPFQRLVALFKENKELKQALA